MILFDYIVYDGGGTENAGLENAGLENAGPNLQGWKRQDRKTWEHHLYG